MKIFRGLLPWLNLVPFLFTVLAAPSPDPTPAEPASVTKSVPECAASPTEYYALPFEFWIETIFLKPYISPSFAPPIVFLPGNPVSIVYDYPSPFNESLKYGRAIITNFRVTQYFTLRFNDLHSPDDSYAIIWTIPVEDFPGYSPLAFDVYGPDLDSSVIYRPLYLSFTAVKKCTSTNETELILRATDFFNDNKPIDFYVGNDYGDATILAKTASNATGEVSPITLRIRPVLRSAKPEPIDISVLGDGFDKDDS